MADKKTKKTKRINYKKNLIMYGFIYKFLRIILKPTFEILTKYLQKNEKTEKNEKFNIY